MIYLSAFEVYWEKEKGKGGFTLIMRARREIGSGPAQLLGRARAVDAGGALEGVRLPRAEAVTGRARLLLTGRGEAH